MRFAYFIFALSLLTPPAKAQDKKDTVPESAPSVLINERPVRGRVLEVDGKHFVAVEDLAQSFRGTISYGDGQIALTLPQLEQPTSSRPQSPAAHGASSQDMAPYPQPTAQQHSSSPTSSPSPQRLATAMQTPEIGRVQGTLTYFFDFHVGDKPDTGSKVWLVQGHVEIPADKEFVGTSTAVGTSEAQQQYEVIKYSITDEKGHFELSDIPPGEYTLIMQSAHTKGTLKEKRSFFGRGNGRSPRDSTGRVEFLNLGIRAGETVDASRDFGPNID